jgi:hypothetical protein
VNGTRRNGKEEAEGEWIRKKARGKRGKEKGRIRQGIRKGKGSDKDFEPLLLTPPPPLPAANSF